MPASDPTLLQIFHRFVGKELEADSAMTPEEALALWREQLEAVAAIREGLADVEAGCTKPARTALRTLAKKFGIEAPGK